MEPAEKEEVLRPQLSELDPRLRCGTGYQCDFELDWPIGLVQEYGVRSHLVRSRAVGHRQVTAFALDQRLYSDEIRRRISVQWWQRQFAPPRTRRSGSCRGQTRRVPALGGAAVRRAAVCRTAADDRSC